MNKWCGIGRLTKDPDLRYTEGNGTAVCNITVAVDKFVQGEKQADFIHVVVWGKQAESLANYMLKGSKISIEGAIQTRNYENKDGVKVYITEVVADRVEFLESKKEQEEPQQNNRNNRNNRNNGNRNNNK